MREGRCPECRRWVPLRRDGLLRYHVGAELIADADPTDAVVAGRSCAGTGAEPKAPPQ